MYAYFVCSICNGLIIILYCYLVDGYMNPDHLFIPYKYSVPWNQKTFLGWATSSTYSMTAAGFFVFVNSIFISFFMGVTYFFQAFCITFRILINKANFTKVHANIKKSLCDAILFHRFSKKYLNNIPTSSLIFITKAWEIFYSIFWDTADIYDDYLLVEIVCSTLHISTCIFQLDFEVKHLDVNIVFILNALIVASLTLFLYCYHGVLATNCFLNYSDCLFELPWYHLPVKFQKYVFLMISNTQHPLCFKANQFITLNLEAFTSVCISKWNPEQKISLTTNLPEFILIFVGNEYCFYILFNDESCNER